MSDANGNKERGTHELCQEHSGIMAKTSGLEKQVANQWAIIEKLQTRLPLWATGAISGLTFFLGMALSWIIHLQSLMSNMKPLMALFGKTN